MHKKSNSNVAESFADVKADNKTSYLNLCLENLLQSENASQKLKYLALAEKYAHLENTRRKKSITTDLISHRFGCAHTEEEQTNLIKRNMSKYLETNNREYFFFSMCLELILNAQKHPNASIAELLKYLEDWIELAYKDK